MYFPSSQNMFFLRKCWESNRIQSPKLSGLLFSSCLPIRLEHVPTYRFLSLPCPWLLQERSSCKPCSHSCLHTSWAQPSCQGYVPREPKGPVGCRIPWEELGNPGIHRTQDAHPREPKESKLYFVCNVLAITVMFLRLSVNMRKS